MYIYYYIYIYIYSNNMFPNFHTAILMLHLDKTDRTICTITEFIKKSVSTFSGSQTRYIPT
jgi:hypothetical protein